MQQGMLSETLTEREQDVARLMVAGLSAREIADELFLKYSSVRWYLKQIYSKLDVHSFEEAVEALESSGTAIADASPRRHNLPPKPSPLIGREAEIHQLSDKLRQPDARLISLIGPGGIGKTRLALELAWHHLGDFPDGAYFVPLQPLRSPDDIVTTTIDTLGIQLSGGDPRSFLLGYLDDKQLLLVMDNFEHLLDGVDLLTDILSAGTQVKIVVTSRAVLNLQEEWVWQVRGLAVPDEANLSESGEFGAVRLFTTRAQQVKHDFSLDDEQSDVNHICQLVEGMPLALELAASWVRTLPCATIAGQIEQTMDFPTARARNAPQRHASMRAVFNHSWHHLSAGAQAVFGKLSVFRGGFTFEAAQAVANANVMTLAELVDQSLVRRNKDGRYDLQELLRQFGAEHLERCGDRTATEDAHSAYFSDFVNKRAPEIKGHRQVEAMDEIDADLDNVRAAWLWAADNKRYDRLEPMIEGLFWYRNQRGHLHDVFAQAWARLAPSDGEEAHPVSMKIFVRMHEFNHAPMEDVERGLDAAKQSGDIAEIVFCELLRYNILAFTDTNYPQLVDLIEDTIHIYHDEIEAYYQAYLMSPLSYSYFTLNNREKGAELQKQMVEQFRGMGNRIQVAWSMVCSVKWGRNRDLQALHDALDIFVETNVPAGESEALIELGTVSIGNAASIRNASDYLQKGLQIALDINYGMGVADACANLSVIASLQDDYETAIGVAQRGNRYSRHTNRQTHINTAMSMAACGLGDFALARRHFTDNLQILHTSKDFDIAAVLLAHAGELEWAIELLAMETPCSLGFRLEQWELLARLKSDLEAELGTEVYQAAWERGKHRDPNETLRELKVYFGVDETPHA